MTMTEPREMRLKRLRIRSWRRGTKEMDMILGPFADAALADLSEAELDLYEALLSEPDTDLYRWFSGADAMPARYADLARRIARVRWGGCRPFPAAS